MITRTALLLVISATLLGGCGLLPQNLSEQPPSASVTPQPSPVAVTEDLSLSSPQPGDTISSPLEITGEATGGWFFEGQMNATIRTESGPTFGTAVLTADGEWMTEQKVPFSGRLTFLAPPGEDVAILVIEADNPSGLPENAKTVEIPVRLRQE